MTRSELIQSATFMIANHSDYPDIKSTRLNHCMAWRISSNYSKWILLQSYKTIVAAYDKNTEILYVFNYYSVTTAQHVAKFNKWLLQEMNPRPVKRINLYNDSKTPKYIWDVSETDDFASVIASALEK